MPEAAVADYYSRPRHELVDLLPPRPRRVLDVGCGAGMLGAEVKRRHPGCAVIGVEANADAARVAARSLDRVIVGDVETLALDDVGPLDAILYGDVLEHLVDPWTVVRRHATLLADGGRVVASLPNVRSVEVLLGLLRGTWEYADAGILDRSHLRFFTRREGERLFADAGLTVVGVQPLYWHGTPPVPPGTKGTVWVELDEFRISGLAADTVHELWAGQLAYVAERGGRS
jgi:SAM-dependent methyltransferase